MLISGQSAFSRDINTLEGSEYFGILHELNESSYFNFVEPGFENLPPGGRNSHIKGTGFSREIRKRTPKRNLTLP